MNGGGMKILAFFNIESFIHFVHIVSILAVVGIVVIFIRAIHSHFKKGL